MSQPFDDNVSNENVVKENNQVFLDDLKIKLFSTLDTTTYASNNTWYYIGAILGKKSMSAYSVKEDVIIAIHSCKNTKDIADAYIFLDHMIQKERHRILLREVKEDIQNLPWGPCVLIGDINEIVTNKRQILSKLHILMLLDDSSMETLYQISDCITKNTR